MPRSLLDPSTESCARLPMTPSDSVARCSSLLMRISRCGATPASLTKSKLLVASRHAALACHTAPAAATCHAPSRLRCPKAPVRTEATRCADVVSASTPPVAPAPLPTGSAPSATVADCNPASGMSDTSAMPVAGSLSGMPSSVIATCSRRAPRSDRPVSPRAERRLVYGISARTAFTVEAPAVRAAAVCSVAVVRPAVRTSLASAAVRAAVTGMAAKRAARVASRASSDIQLVSSAWRGPPGMATTRGRYPARAMCRLSACAGYTARQAPTSRRDDVPTDGVGRHVSTAPISGARVRASATQIVAESMGG